jgi:hypothetical protein
LSAWKGSASAQAAVDVEDRARHQEASGEVKYATAAATSSGGPSRPRGISGGEFGLALGETGPVAIGEQRIDEAGQTQLQRIWMPRGPYSTATAGVREITPSLAAAYDETPGAADCASVDGMFRIERSPGR